MAAIPFRALARLWLDTADPTLIENAIEALFLAANAPGRNAFKAAVKADLTARLGLERDALNTRLTDVGDS